MKTVENKGVIPMEIRGVKIFPGDVVNLIDDDNMTVMRDGVLVYPENAEVEVSDNTVKLDIEDEEPKDKILPKKKPKKKVK